MEAPSDPVGFLAGLTGFPAEAFADPARGLARLLRGCDCHDVFGAPRDATAEDRAVQARAAARWRRRPWRKGFDRRNLAFLDRQPAFLPSVLTNRPASVIGHLPLGIRQATFGLDEGELVVLLSVGPAALGLYYPRRNRFLALALRPLPWRPALRDAIGLLLNEPARMAAWLRAGMAGRLTPAFVLGDNRIGHFIRDSLSYLDVVEEAHLLPMLRAGGRLVVVRDWCAMDPLALFPALAGFDPVETDSAALTALALDRGFSAHRVYRLKARPDAQWLRDRIARLRAEGRLPAEPPTDPPHPGPRLRVLVSVDAERRRFANQVDALRLVLRRLGEACARSGLALEVAWDGWTVSGEPRARDAAVMAEIRATIAAVEQDLRPMPARRIDLFGLSATAKIAATEASDLVLVTRGSGAIVPCWLLRRPTIHYNLPGATDRSCLDEGAAIDLPEGAEQDVSETLPDGTRPPRFAVSLPALEAALARALGDRLPGLMPDPTGVDLRNG